MHACERRSDEAGAASDRASLQSRVRGRKGGRPQYILNI